MVPHIFLRILSHQRNHRMWRDADVECWKPCIESKRATLGHDLHSAVDGAFVQELASLGIWLLFLHHRLHEVKWQGKERGKETSDGRCAENLCRARHAHAFQEIFARCIESQHTK